MAGRRTRGWRNDRWNSLRGRDKETLRAILHSLEEWLANPTFENGINLGSGGLPTADPDTGVMVPPPTVEITPAYLEGLDNVPDDDAAPPAAAGIAISAGVRSVFVSWDASTAVDVKDGWGTYRVQVDDTSDFSSPVVDKVIGGTSTTITGLTTGTTYYARVAAVDAHGNQGDWSGTVSAAPVSVANVDIAAGAITADKIQANTITAAQIAADTITAEELDAITLEVGKYIRSSNFVAGTSGFELDAAGDAELNEVTVRGDIVADSFVTSGGSNRVEIGEDGSGNPQSAIYFVAGGNIVGHMFGITSSGGGMYFGRGATIGSAAEFLAITGNGILMTTSGSGNTIIDNVPSAGSTSMEAAGGHSNWSQGNALRMQAFEDVLSFSGGTATLNYGYTFNGVLCIQILNQDGTAGPDTIFSASSIGQSSCTVHAYAASGAGANVTGSRRVGVLVIGW
jgi:hypothetical protein